MLSQPPAEINFRAWDKALDTYRYVGVDPPLPNKSQVGAGYPTSKVDFCLLTKALSNDHLRCLFSQWAYLLNFSLSHLHLHLMYPASSMGLISRAIFSNTFFGDVESAIRLLEEQDEEDKANGWNSFALCTDKSFLEMCFKCSADCGLRFLFNGKYTIFFNSFHST